MTKTEITIYHNPRCSKSRQTLELIRERHIEPEIVFYLEDTPSREELQALLEMLGMSPRELIRTSEQAYKERGLKDASDDELLQAMVEEPRLIQRPIVVSGQRAVLGRPPENVLGLIE